MSKFSSKSKYSVALRIRKHAASVFIRSGILPWFLLTAILIFSLSSDSFLTTYNIMLIGRQSTYLVLAALGQMVALLTAGLDLSVGAIFAFTSVITAMVMVSYLNAYPEAIWMSILIGSLAGLTTGIVIGAVNGVGIAIFQVPPFIMTLATASIMSGLALKITAGVPIYGMPEQFSEIFGYGLLGGIAVPTLFAAGFAILMYVILSWTRMGRYIYAIGGNPKAALLSGIRTRLHLFMAYVLCGGITAVAAVLMTARLESGEANLGQAYPLQSIAACVIGGVSIFGGIGRVPSVVLGAIFIILVQNGMHSMHIDSYTQLIVIGILLTLAIIADNFRQRLIRTIGD
ncbi:MAG: ABC transporter permease [Kordiimonadaceae bacterium]|jgi:ribose transport system permease protein|nr:ABC transporter permease [Kordiimonadaceae bacterium]